GIMIRLKVSTLRIMGRATQGVKLINLKEGDAIAAVTKVDISEDDEDLNEEEGLVPENGVDQDEDGTIVAEGANEAVELEDGDAEEEVESGDEEPDAEEGVENAEEPDESGDEEPDADAEEGVEDAEEPDESGDEEPDTDDEEEK
ncbi:MAG: hypothetical protein JKX74_02035, partial [Flavobacteriales bacterium]|nr:hypothetical protein [Flavobacteriales bacterium]